MVVTGVLRLVTSPRVFADPGTVEGAIAFMDVVRESPSVELKACADEWPRPRNMLLTLGHQGNLVTDAWIAATVQVFFEHLVTFDRDFTRLMPGRDHSTQLSERIRFSAMGRDGCASIHSVQCDEQRFARFSGDGAADVTLAGRILRKENIAGTQNALGSVTDFDFHFSL